MWFAIEFEERAATIYVQLASRFSQDPKKIAITLPDHVDELLAAARKFGIENHAMKELNRLKKDCFRKTTAPPKNV